MLVGFGVSDASASFFLGKLSDRLGRTATLGLGAVCQGAIMILLFIEKKKALTMTFTEAMVPHGYETTWLTPCGVGAHTFNSHDSTADVLQFVAGNPSCSCTIDKGQPGAGTQWLPSSASSSSHPDLTCDCGACEQGQWEYLIVCAVLWGIGDAVWNTQISALIGGGWPDQKEDVFANFKMWQSLMTAAAFSYSSFLGWDGKLAIVMGFLCLSIPW